MSELEKVRKYWDIYSGSVSDNYKDHWIDSNGNPLDNVLYKEIASYVSKYIKINNSEPTEIRILEIGCGSGKIIKELKLMLPENTELVGIDFSSVQIETAEKNVKYNGVYFFVCDILDFEKTQKDFSQKGFDIIFTHSVTQYFPGQEYFLSFLQSCHSQLKIGGSLLLIDVPIIWYLDYMRSTPAKSFLTPIKNLVKKLIGYKPKQIEVVSAIEVVDGKAIEVPTFKGFWLDPETASTYAKTKFEDFKMEIQSFEFKPVDYKKFRPNFLFLSKTK